VSVNPHSRAPAKPPACKLQAPGWTRECRPWLEDLIRKGAGQRLPVVLDFDNTLICGDVSEVTLAVLVKSGLLTVSRLPATFSPPFRPDGGTRVTLESCADIAQYYETFMSPSAHGSADRSPFANGYVWAVEIMEGLRPLDVVNATRTALQDSQAGKPAFIEVTPGTTTFPVPFFYPEMVELVAELLRHRFDLWVVSAGNVWSMRWMLLEMLNPRLRQLGLRRGLRPDHLLGVSTLLADSQDRLYKDTLLVRDSLAYARLDEKTLGALRLTSRLQFPVPAYSGKLACLFDAIGRNPYLCVGDSPGDHAMMAVSQHRLWIARLEKPGFQRVTAQLVRQTRQADWKIQPTLTRQTPGFVPTPNEIARRLSSIPPEVRESLRVLGRLAPVSRQPTKEFRLSSQLDGYEKNDHSRPTGGRPARRLAFRRRRQPVPQPAGLDRLTH